MRREDQNRGRPGTKATLCVCISLCIALVCPRRFYEVKLLTGGMMRMGWATPSYHAGQQLGADENSYAFDGFLVREPPSSTHAPFLHSPFLPLSAYPLSLQARKWHHGSESYGRRWNTGDIVGCLLDVEEKTICMPCMCATIVNSVHMCVSHGAAFTLNGELLQGSFESTVAFENINTLEGLVPAITLSAGERAQLNFGKSKVGGS